MRILLIGVLLLLAACSSEENKPATQQQVAPVAKSAEQAAQQVDEAAQALKQTAETAVEQAKTVVSEQAAAAKAAAAQTVQETATRVAAAVESGQLVYSASCKSCHGSGLMGAPKLGDPSLQGDIDKLVQNAINGIGRMPARGGVASLSDAKVRAAVTYMVEQSR